MMLSEIPPLKDLPPPTLTLAEEERIKEDLFKKLDLKSFREAGDLSMKVSWSSTSRTVILLGLAMSVEVWGQRVVLVLPTCISSSVLGGGCDDFPLLQYYYCVCNLAISVAQLC